MNKSRTVVIADSGCDIPQIIRKQYDIRVLPLHVLYPEKDYKDGVDIDPMMIYKRFPEFPSTSTPSVAEVQDMFEAVKKEGFENAIVVTISSRFSGTNNAVRLAAEDEEDLQVFNFDTRNISVAAGLLAIYAARKLEAGASFADTCNALKRKRGSAHVFFYMDTLKYLQRGGRIGKVASALGSVLKLKPIITCDAEGEYVIAGKIRGARLGKLKLLEEVTKVSIGHKPWAIVGEGMAHEEAMAFEKMLIDAIPDVRVLYETQITACMALNTGPGLVGVGILQDPDD